MVAQTKLTDEIVQAICDRKRAEPAMTQDALAVEFNFNRTSIKKALMMLNVPAGVAADESGITMLDHASIAVSPLNPRKTFDAELLAELADSIYEQRLLQNLVVRDAPNGGYILVNGERRWRAIGLLIAEGRWREKLPCRVIEADDGMHLAIALLENMQREDVAPLEEADAFVQLQALDPVLWTTAHIAEKLSRTPRFVQQRLAMGSNLCADGKALLRAGKLNVEAARMLSSETADLQKEILYQIWPGESDDDKNLIITDDDDAIPVGEVRQHLAYIKRCEENRQAAEQREVDRAAAVAAGTPLPAEGEDPKDASVEDEAIIQRQAERDAQNEADHLARVAEKEAAIEQYHLLCVSKPSDYEEGYVLTEGEHCCNHGCKFRMLLNWTAPSDFHVCIKPRSLHGSPRTGLLTHGEQAGRDCFEVL